MKIEKKTTSTIQLGDDITVIVQAGNDGVPSAVAFDRGGQVYGEMRAVDIERVAEMLSELRRGCHDYRSVCADHGYLEEHTSRCKHCEAEAPRARAEAEAAATATAEVA